VVFPWWGVVKEEVVRAEVEGFCSMMIARSFYAGSGAARHKRRTPHGHKAERITVGTSTTDTSKVSIKAQLFLGLVHFFVTDG